MQVVGHALSSLRSSCHFDESSQPQGFELGGRSLCAGFCVCPDRLTIWIAISNTWPSDWSDVLRHGNNHYRTYRLATARECQCRRSPSFHYHGRYEPKPPKT